MSQFKTFNKHITEFRDRLINIFEIKTVKFANDYPKLKNTTFTTIRSKYSYSKYVKGCHYLIKTPTKEFKVRCIGVESTFLPNIRDEFLMQDTNTDSRAAAIKELQLYYPDLTETSRVIVVFFEKVGF